MLLMIEEWKQSGQNQRTFCKAHSITYHQFHYWYKQSKLADSPTNDQVSSFIQVRPSVTEEKSCAEIIYPNGKRILFHQAVGVHFLKTLLG